jgi:hypothetical protein
MQGKQPPSSNHHPVLPVVDEFPMEKQAAFVVMKVRNRRMLSIPFNPEMQGRSERTTQRFSQRSWDDSSKELFR